MGSGIFGEIQDLFVGEADIDGNQGFNSPLGDDFRTFLQDRLNTPIQDTEQFRLGRESIRTGVEEIGGTARQRLGDTAATGGFQDSGAVGSGLREIDRAEIGAFAQGIRDLILGLEEQRTEGILPFLGGAAQENLGIAQFNLARRGQDAQIYDTVNDNIMEALQTFMGGGGGSSSVSS